VDIDHTDLLGEDRLTIGREKAGIFRAGALAICADVDTPDTVEESAARCGCTLYKYGVDFHYHSDATSWQFRSGDHVISDLPIPAPGVGWQFRNLSAAVMALEALGENFDLPDSCLREGLAHCAAPGRLQTLSRQPECIVDVAHNPSAGRGLAAALHMQKPTGRSYAVVAMLEDKDVPGTVEPLVSLFDEWFVASLTVPRGAAAQALCDGVLSVHPQAKVHAHANVTCAYRAALQRANPWDRIVVFGSFHTVAEVVLIECKAGPGCANS
jgi:dihydrofolate synthase/folylpolyglutamate synthase